MKAFLIREKIAGAVFVSEDCAGPAWLLALSKRAYAGEDGGNSPFAGDDEREYPPGCKSAALSLCTGRCGSWFDDTIRCAMRCAKVVPISLFIIMTTSLYIPVRRTPGTLHLLYVAHRVEDNRPLAGLTD